jgi:hypothetical protein
MPARMDPASRVLLSDRGHESGPSIGKASARSTRRCMLYPSATGSLIKEWTARSGHLGKAPSQGGGSGRMTYETCLPSTKYSSFLRPICLLMVTSSRSLCTQPHVTFFPGRGSRTRSTHLQKPRAATPPPPAKSLAAKRELKKPEAVRTPNTLRRSCCCTHGPWYGNGDCRSASCTQLRQPGRRVGHVSA